MVLVDSFFFFLIPCQAHSVISHRVRALIQLSAQPRGEITSRAARATFLRRRAKACVSREIISSIYGILLSALRCGSCTAHIHDVHGVVNKQGCTHTTCVHISQMFFDQPAGSGYDLGSTRLARVAGLPSRRYRANTVIARC